MPLSFNKTDIPGVIIIEPAVFNDSRGFFLETYHYDKYSDNGLDTRFVQDNHSHSVKGTLRGLHYQLKKPQGKLLYVIKKYPKHVIVTAHYEWVETEEGAVEKRIMVKGKEWKGMVEKDFTVVQYVDMKLVDGKRQYFITLNSDGKSSAKTPPMFLNEGEETIENDYSKFIDRVKERLNK